MSKQSDDMVASKGALALMIRIFLVSFFGALRRLIDAELPGQGRELVRRIRAAYPMIVAANPDLVVDRQSAGHLRMCAAVLAAYRVLAAALGDEKAVKLLTAAYGQFMRRPIKLLMRTGLALSRDPLKLMARVWGNPALSAKTYGQSFAFAAEVTPGALRFDTQRCFFFDFFRRQGLPHVTTVLCAADNNWIEELNRRPDVHGEYILRLSTGGSLCRFMAERRQL